VARARLGFTALFGSVTLVALLFLIAGHRASAFAILPAFPIAVLVSLPFALGAAAVRAVSRSGALAGLAIASTLLAGAGWPAWLQLGVVLICSLGATRLGHARNAKAGLLDDAHGRGWRSVTANTGLAACAALYARDPGTRDMAMLVIASVLTTGASDTVASEIGKAFGGRSVVGLVPIRRVASGTPGGVSLVGTLAGVTSVCAMAMCAGAMGLAPASKVPVIAIAAVGAVLLDSIIAGIFESRAWLDNDGVNLMATLAAALGAAGLGTFWS
jgi:uncharacterized protein (TIGR00297 family)